jgi:hypothetical protein
MYGKHGVGGSFKIKLINKWNLLNSIQQVREHFKISSSPSFIKLDALDPYLQCNYST